MGTLARKRGEVKPGPGRYDNIENLYPIAYQEPDLVHTLLDYPTHR